MKPSPLAAVVAIVAVILFSAGLWFISAPPSRLRAEAQIADHVERARRLLEQFNVSLEQSQTIADELAQRGVDVDLEDVDELAEEEDFVDYFQKRHEEAWTTFQPMNWQADPPRPERPPGYGNIAGLARKGLSEQHSLDSRNGKLLDRALQEISAAMAVGDGDVSGRNDAEANRLKGIILYHQGLTDALRARLVRNDATRLRQRLVELSDEVLGAQAAIRRAEGTELAEKTDELKDRMRERSSDLDRHKGELAALDEVIGQTEAKLASARSRLDAARAEMDALREKGLDFSQENAAAVFEENLMALDAKRRQAERDVQTLQYGDIPAARLAPGQDYLTGQYVQAGTDQPQTVRGLESLKGDREILATRVAELQAELDNLGEDIDRLVKLRQARDGLRSGAESAIAEARSQAKDIYTLLDDIESQAQEIEDAALGKLDQSAKASGAAARLAGESIRQARERTEGIAPAALERSPFKPRLDDNGVEAAAGAQEADALLAAAWVRLHQYLGNNADATCLAVTREPLMLPGADEAARRADADEARSAGAELISEAMRTLEQAHRKGRRHWTYVAQQAGADYLLALFGYTDYRKDAVEAYRSALKGRENEPYTGVYNDAIAALGSP
ncbi:MAG: hypothetical protein J5J06_02420 [Phycisphaerae bacterium]|nr:hypothetical protein [Phycisphaerae bacterium]